jgi:deoxycytidylate deaminase
MHRKSGTSGNNLTVAEAISFQLPHTIYVIYKERLYAQDKVNYYLDIAESVLRRSTCLRRQYGALIVRNDEIVPRL